MKIVVTGSAGFIGGYLVEELLNNGHEVTGIDNYSKYGKISKSYDDHPRYRFVRGDCKDTGLLQAELEGADHFVAMAAMIGGISYFHQFAYDLIAENERITASAFDAAMHAFKEKRLKKITVLSSSMVFENSDRFPSKEGDQFRVPPPESTYGFQKLSTEYFARGAWEQYGLPFTIVRPFNCVGIGETRAVTGKRLHHGNIELAMSHVVPDLVQKVLKGQNPLQILGSGQQIRHYTYGGDIGRGIRFAIENEAACNEDFNISTAVSTTVMELAELIWRKVHGNKKPFRHTCVDPFPHDVQKRVPAVDKARDMLGFEATTDLESVLDEVIPWIEDEIREGRL